MKRPLLFALMLTLAPAFALADGGGANTPLTRDQVTLVKRKLQAVATALGVPAGYEKAREEFSLPTDASPSGDKKTFYPISGGMQLTFDGGQKRMSQNAEAQGQEMQKKMSAAMAAGDYEAIAKMQQDMVAQMNAQQGAAMEAGAKGDISVSIRLNGGGGGGIDPDNILLEKPGVLALKEASSGGPRQRVMIYFDPGALAKTQTLTSIDLRSDKRPTPTAVLNIAVDVNGPTAALEPWVKKINTDAVLAQIDK